MKVQVGAMDPAAAICPIFAGYGGRSTGLHMAGWKGLFAVERNPAAFATLNVNLVDGRTHFDWPRYGVSSALKNNPRGNPPSRANRADLLK